MIVNIGKGIELDVAVATEAHEGNVTHVTGMATHVIEHVIKIGLRNILMDSHAGVNAKAMPELSADDVVAQSRAVAEKKLDAMYRGEVRTAGTRGPKASADPVGAEIKRLAKGAVLSWAKAKGKTKDEVNTNLSEWMAKYEAAKAQELRAQAEANVTAKAAANADIGDLLG